MLKGNLRHGKGSLKVLKNIVADGAVRLDYGVLVFRQVPRFTENVRWDGNLADVMHDRGEAQYLHPQRAEPEPDCYPGGQFGRSILMLGCERISMPVCG